MTSGVISTFVWIHFRSFGCAALSFVSGVFIDLDHLLEYFTHYKFTFSLKRIYCACARSRFKRLYLVIHSYELVILLWIAIYAFGLSNAWKAVAIGMTQHIIFDQLTNPLRRYGYFMTYRIAQGFRKEKIVRIDPLTGKIEGRTGCPR